MFALSAATKVYLAAGATDLRKGFDGLCAIVEGVLEEAPLSGHVFLFANGARTRLKVLVWDGSGMWVCTKKLGRGRAAPDGVGPRLPAPSRHQGLGAPPCTALPMRARCALPSA